jgi:hypothetical protein
MPTYRVYSLDDSYRATSADRLLCHDDASAIAAATSLAGDHVAVEVWRGSQIIAQFPRQRDEGSAGKRSRDAFKKGKGSAGVSQRKEQEPYGPA